MNSQRDIPLTVFKPHVQIYAIVELGSDDYQLLGHGFLSIINDQIENETVHYLEVQSVQDSQVLLRSRLRLNNNYEKQRGSVIVWNDSEHKKHYDLAVSFETDHQCDIFWRLICEKIGKNYLEISGSQPLQNPTENNLPYILEKTKNSKDLVEYNLLHNPAFSSSLFQVFKKFQSRGDKMGMGMVGRIVKSIFTNLDYKMIQVLFKDPTFDLILQVQKFLQKIDFPLFWSEKLKIKTFMPLNEQLNNKIRIIHRLNFYRQSILDLMKQTNLEQMLVMTTVQFSKDIILQLTKSNIIDQLVKMPYQATQDQLLIHKDIAQEETFLSETDEIKRTQFAQMKMNFLLQALVMSKQIQDQNARLRFVDKLYKSGVTQMASQFVDRGVYRAFDFLICLAQSSPIKFIEHLKVNYRQNPSDNLHIKMCKKYNLGNEQMQNLILQIVKYVSECFRNKQNLEFFDGTFFSLIFGGCKDYKAVLAVLSQIQNNLQNVESFFGQVIKSKVLHKLTMFLRSQRHQKITELRAIKVLKRVLFENADSSWSFKKIFLQELNNEVITSGFFEYCLQVLLKNFKFNNIICSSMLENLKILSQINRFTKFHAFIQRNFAHLATENQFIAKIMLVQEQILDSKMQSQQPASFQKQLQQQKEEAYFLSEMQQQPIFATNNDEQMQQLQNLRKMRREISQQERQREDSEISMLSQPTKKVKRNSDIQEPPAMIELGLSYLDLEGNH